MSVPGLNNRHRQPNGRNPYRQKSATYGYCRYADDFLVTAKCKQDIEAIIPVLEQWLRERGLKLHPDKTQVVNVQQGCHFLGFTIRHLGGKCLCVPHKEKVKAFVQGIRDWLKANTQAKPESIINYLNPRLRGWGNYYRHGVSKRVFSYVDDQLWKAIWRWCRKRHPNKGGKWVARKYFKFHKGRHWTFFAATNNRRGEPRTLTLMKVADMPIQRHIKVKGMASPDDPSLHDYWEHVTSTSMLVGILSRYRRLERLERKPSRAVLRGGRHGDMTSFTRHGTETYAKAKTLVTDSLQP